MARPSKLEHLTEPQLAQFMSDLELGMTYELACDSLGITSETFRNWRKWGAEGTEPYAAFFWKSAQAIANGARGLLTDVVAHGRNDNEGDFRALTWLLERRHRASYAKEDPKDSAAKRQVLEGIEIHLHGKDGVE